MEPRFRLKPHATVLVGTLVSLCILLTGCTPKQWTPERRGKMLNDMNANREVGQFRFLDSHPLGKDFTVERYQLDNGLTVILMSDPSAPIFSYHTWVNVGARMESKGITGIAHLFEHLMFKATKNHPAGHYDTVIETNGGRMNAGTSKDWTYYYASLPKGNLDLIASLESDRLQNLILSDEQINTEREVVQEERRYRYENNIDGEIYVTTYDQAFDKHPYSWPVIGHKEDIARINREDCLKFYKTYYAPNNATIVIVGDIDSGQVLKSIQKHYGGIPASEIEPYKATAEPEQTKEKRHTIKNKSLNTEKLTIAYRSPAADSSDRIPLEVLNALLVDGKSSRLYRRLVDETKIATTVSGQVDSYVDPGLMRITVSMVEGKSSREAEKIIYEEIDKLKTEIPSAEEMEKTKNLVESYFVRMLKTSQYKAFMLGYFHTVLGNYQELFTELERFREVKAESINTVAKKYLDAKHRTVIVALPQA